MTKLKDYEKELEQRFAERQVRERMAAVEALLQSLRAWTATAVALTASVQRATAVAKNCARAERIILNEYGLVRLPGESIYDLMGRVVGLTGAQIEEYYALRRAGVSHEAAEASVRGNGVVI